MNKVGETAKANVGAGRKKESRFIIDFHCGD